MVRVSRELQHRRLNLVARRPMLLPRATNEPVPARESPPPARITLRYSRLATATGGSTVSNSSKMPMPKKKPETFYFSAPLTGRTMTSPARPSWSEVPTASASVFADESLGAFVFVAGSFQSVWHSLLHLDKGNSTLEINRARGVLDLDRWYKLRVTARGPHFQCFLDERVIFNFTDELNPRGRVGLRTTFSVARFRNIRVVDPENNLLWDGLPDVPASNKASPANPITEVALDGLNQSMRTRETNLGDLVADSLRWHVNQPELGVPSADIALLNGAGVQNDSVIPKGPILEETIRQVASWEDYVCVVSDVPAAKVKELLEDSISKSPAINNGFLQIGGFKVIYDLKGIAQMRDNKWALTKQGTRVREVTLDTGARLVTRGVVVAGAPSVNVATTDYMAKNYQSFRGCPFTRLDATYQQALCAFIQSSKGLRGVVRRVDYPEGGSGRIQTVKPNGSPR